MRLWTLCGIQIQRDDEEIERSLREPPIRCSRSESGTQWTGPSLMLDPSWHAEDLMTLLQSISGVLVSSCLHYWWGVRHGMKPQIRLPSSWHTFMVRSGRNTPGRKSGRRPKVSKQTHGFIPLSNGRRPASPFTGSRGIQSTLHRPS